MDYERRRLRWYWVTLFVIYCGAVVYFVLTRNPLLYSHLELKQALLAAPDSKVEPVPSPAKQPQLPEKLGDQAYFSRINSEQNGDASSDATYGKNFVETDVVPLSIDEDFHPNKWTFNDLGVVVGGTDAAAAFNWTGQKLWEFRFAPSGKPLSDVLSDSVLSYLISPSGEAIALNKSSGVMQWDLKLKEDVVGPTLLSLDRLLIPLKAHSGEAKSMRPAFRWAVIKRTTGELLEYSKVLDVRPGFELRARRISEFGFSPMKTNSRPSIRKNSKFSGRKR